MSQVIVESADIATAPGQTVRVLIARPKEIRTPLPAVLAWSDIFQHTAAHVRAIRRIASHGFVVVSPELYGRFEPAGTVLDFERDRQRALDDAEKMEPVQLDHDTRAVLDWTRARTDVDPSRVFAMGWCFGGHVAFRAGFLREIRATACCYPTGVHNETLGAAKGTAATLSRARELHGELLLVWGRGDPHIPSVGRAAIHRALDDAAVRFEARLYDTEHTFMRDEGARNDPEAADQAFAAIVELFRRTH